MVTHSYCTKEKKILRTTFLMILKEPHILSTVIYRLLFSWFQMWNLSSLLLLGSRLRTGWDTGPKGSSSGLLLQQAATASATGAHVIHHQIKDPTPAPDAARNYRTEPQMVPIELCPQPSIQQYRDAFHHM